MNTLDKKYTDLLQDILDNGVEKPDRTGTGTISVFGRQIRHKMSEGFPLLTTKKMPFKTIVTELLWFLRGDTDIRFLWKNNNHIWDGDWYKNYCKSCSSPYSLEEMIQFGLEWEDNSKNFDKSIWNLGPIYGKQWRNWKQFIPYDVTEENCKIAIGITDQIQNLINDLKLNPDSRRLMVNAWNVGELDQMVLPPCHYGFQVYTRELSLEERTKLLVNKSDNKKDFYDRNGRLIVEVESVLNDSNIPKRAISLMWNQRSVDTFLGLPFNIASYGLLLEIIAKVVNMVPDELIGNLGDTHLYLDHLEQAKEQIGKIPWEERKKMLTDSFDISEFGRITPFTEPIIHYWLNLRHIPYSRRMPYPLPKLNINTEFWPTEGGECGVGPIDTIALINGFSNDDFCKSFLTEDLQLINYQSHPTIKAPLSN